ncbi:hypothetical protein BGW36DRAFT_421661 [Talaromyces proteolyticus]|uniref:EH domain-containing protein n=1 Tax=Talaromyces proteolyticus TaxID=1131652 RepID=A0AAD4Q679_9EURO|nr:uncharacterized protein BGW36DRAFT_421661 [Talaromyces proteolyticus]KAH8705087.1 hypothetical protein BGW36DRAFT_421661 [Talaromyces proteolyticus]
MSGGAVSVVLDGRQASQRHVNSAKDSTALQGASVAFNAHPAQSGLSNASRNTSKTIRASAMADPTKRDVISDENDTVSEMPQDGLVTDRIKQFSGNLAPRSAHSLVSNREEWPPSKETSFQVQAAALAAARSASRTPQTTSPTPSVLPTRILRDGEHFPIHETGLRKSKPAILGSPSPRPLPAPVPVRKSPAVASSLESMADQSKAKPLLPSRSRSTLSVEERPLRSPVPREAAHDRPGTQAITPFSTGQQPKHLIQRSSELQTEQHNRNMIPSVPRPRRTAATPQERPPRPQPPPRPTNSSFQEEIYTDSSSPIPQERTSSNRSITRSSSVSTRSSYNTSTSDLGRVSAHAQSSTRQDKSHTNEATGMTKESLADAIVASSLASSRSSRAASPLKEPPPLPPHRRTRSRSLLNPTDMFKGEQHRTTPSPSKGLRQTLRDPSKSDDEATKQHSGRHLIRHHPHKYHEGDRKRWRQEVPERERKRYEGVWAANKGLWIPPESLIYEMLPYVPRTLVLSDMVVHLVVRDIWLRSRLPSHTLEAIWDLVDHNRIGLLSREEFVVGLWLIDESLKGHKIPVKVPDSVWDSVRHSPGIKVLHGL